MTATNEHPESQTTNEEPRNANGLESGIVESDSTNTDQSWAESTEAAPADTVRPTKKRIQIIEVTSPVTIAIIGGVRAPEPRAES